MTRFFPTAASLRARPGMSSRLTLAAFLAAWLLLPLAATSRAGDERIPDSQRHPPAFREELLERLGVTRWHTVGVRGAGVKVAVLDSGFRGYRTFLGSSLPASVTARSFRKDGNLEAKDSQHGILCGEVVHTLAPDADVLFANWEPESPQAFLDAVRWAKKEGARVITCSVIMPSWSDGDGHGSVHEQLARILGDEVLFFASAGNTARRHWTGTFHDRGDGFHEWDRNRVENALSRLGTERVSIELCWKPGPDYELLVIDRGTRETVASSVPRRGVVRGAAVARFTPKEDHSYAVEIRHVRGTPGSFHLVALSSGSEMEFADYHGSVCFPADGPEVVAVGAVDGSGQRQPYSACGPNAGETKPDLVARVPFPSQWRETPFSGTSAASPQAAALAALWMSRDPTATVAGVRNKLRTSATCLGKSGPSCETGFGLIHLP